MKNRWWWKVLLVAGAASLAWGGTFGKVVAIGGHASDLVLDEARGVLYVANFTANRIEVLSLASHSIQTSMNVAPQPGSMALSPDGRYLVVAHFGNFQAPNTPRNALTVIDLDGGGRQTFALGSPPLGVAFGLNNLALVVTAQEFLLFDPVSGTTQLVDTITGVTAKTLPQPPANFPPQIIAASLGVSGDGWKIYGLTDTLEFSFDVLNRQLRVMSYVSQPPAGPRTVSVSQDGSYYLAGWALNDKRGSLVAQFPNAKGLLNVGSHAIDTARGLVYAQIPEAVVSTQAAGAPAPAAPVSGTPSQGVPVSTPVASDAPVLRICDADNLAVRERLLLAENLAGRSVLSSDGAVLYALSDSGVTVLPVGALKSVRRVQAAQEDLVFRSGNCDRQVATQEVTIFDPGGAQTEFTVSSTLAGVRVSPASGVTPATLRVSVDPAAFQNQSGTVAGYLKVQSASAVNQPPQVRVLVNLHEPDQRGSSFNVPGKLVDILADPARDRFFVLRQDKNQVLVYDGATYGLVATLRTGNTPTQMAITFDRRFLVVGNDNSQIANVFDLETLEPSTPIRFPGGHYPRSIASSGKAMLAACRVAGPKHTIDRIDMGARTATELPALGVYENSVHINTVLVAAPNGSSILAAQADGNLLLYSANADSFTISRKDFSSLAGAYAASSFDQFVVGNSLLNSSLVQARQFETGTGSPSGFAFVDQSGFRTTAASASAPGVIQRVDLASGAGQRATRMVEAPLLPETGAAFTRTLAPLYSRGAILSLTTSGFTALAWNYDASVAAPRIERVVNAADLTAAVAPGGLISVLGRDLSVTNLATREMPLPTALGESCLSVNGVAAPMLWVSPAQINAQLPFQSDGNVTLILRTPGGVSDNFNMTILPAAPSVFRNGTAGPDTSVPAVVRAANNQLVTLSNPVHRGDALVIYLTGMGRTTPAVDAGLPAPGDPPASVLIAPEVTLGGVGLPVSFAGLAPGQIGVYQINARVPAWAPAGFAQPLTISQGGGSTSLEVRVVE
ncbi:MAG: hypothetical protein HY822_16585 [Acidobacteria bacterium]|nr:hypothetical protein [Acidobacteriota bacterium]